MKQKDSSTSNRGKKMEITDERIREILCTAFEGGVGYWACIMDYRKPAVEPKHDLFNRYCTYPVTPDGAVIMQDAECPHDRNEDETCSTCEVWTLDRKAIERGLQVMARKFPAAWSDFVDENDDALTGDVFVQCCIFGELVYG